MEFSRMLFFAFVFCVVYPLFAYFVGLGISKTRFHKIGIRMIAMSGWFPRSLPKHCKMSDCDMCGNWNCPKYCK